MTGLFAGTAYYQILVEAAGQLLRMLGSGFLHHGFMNFFAGLFSMPIAFGAFLAAILTILIAAFLVPLTVALGLTASKSLFDFGAILLLAAVWAANTVITKYHNKLLYKYARIIPLNAAAGADILWTGFKGKGLGLLRKLNINTPEGFIINGAVFERWVKSRKLGAMIRKLSASEDADMQIEELIRSSSPPFFFRRKFRKALRYFESGELILRSSFPGEDGKTASMAGVFESVISNSDIKSALAALAKVYASYFSQRAIAARIDMEPSEGPLLLPVIVQRRIRHEVFFIGCSVNYFNGLIEEMVLSYETCQGGSGVVRYNVFTKGVSVIDGPAELSFGDMIVAELADLMNKLEARYDKPVQIEAGLLNKTLYVYQARPLTGFHPVDTLVNSFIVDIVDIPLTPLSKDLFGLPDSLGNRMSKRLAPFGLSKQTAAFTEHKGRVYLNYNTVRPYLNPHYMSMPRFVLHTLSPSIRVMKDLLDTGCFNRRYKKIKKRLENAQKEGAVSISYLRNSILLPLFHLQLDLFEFSGILGGRYDSFISKVFCDLSETERQALQPIMSPQFSPWKNMLDALQNLDASDKDQVNAFMQKYGHWGNPESEVSAPRIADDMTSWLCARPDVENNAPTAPRQQAGNHEAVVEKLRNKWERSVFNTGLMTFRFLYGRRQRILSLREEIRDNLNRAMFEVKKSVVALNRGDDVFFMTVAEIEKGAPARDVVEKRKSEYAAFHDEYPGAVVHIPEIATAEAAEPGSISCLGIGSEVVEGLALVADGPLRFSDYFKPVLIVAAPDGIYGTAIGNISALVIERGSPLSHLVILAREAGIPVLIGGAGIMEKIKTGDSVKIDAGRGLLQIG